MAVVLSLTSLQQYRAVVNPNSKSFKSQLKIPNRSVYSTIQTRRSTILNVLKNRNSDETSTDDDDEVNDLGVKVALSVLKFYKREISPVIPRSCRYVPTCSEYSMEAYKKYGVAKGTILTAWRLCRCNPLGGSGFDPPRWFDEEAPSEE
ncbi:UPF0161 protein At3g09310 isoform X2 [Tripterygium wilfordii]|uniref:UPF0161 protein At3g09310 isoform X2 n=1 Tax=Tripterygium wilfordii TaxID=458696 RepID=UPI0018F83B7B|nr:UPF0161 protein At3g09310 isoform X2 [Tripterygium wilfordii]